MDAALLRGLGLSREACGGSTQIPLCLFLLRGDYTELEAEHFHGALSNWGVYSGGSGGRVGRDSVQFFKVQGWVGAAVPSSFSSGPLFSLRTECPPVFCRPVGSKEKLEALQLLCLPGLAPVG